MRRTAVVLAIAVLAGIRCSGAEVQLYFSALQRILAEQVFTQDGRLYVRGNAKNKCSFAYLERPSIMAESGFLVVKARFSGRSARNFFGRCLGLGDSFDVRIIAAPQYRNGALALRDVRVESPGRESFYIRRVRAAMADSLARQFKYSLDNDAKRILEIERPNSPYHQELRGFDVKEIRVLPDSVLVVLDFRLAVR